VKIVLLGGEPTYLARFRGHLLRTLKERGHRVSAWAGAYDLDVERELQAAGIGFDTFPLRRTGLRPDREWETLFTLYRMLQRERPDLLITTTPKVIGYGGLAARWAAIPRSVALVTGLGMAFDSPRHLVDRVRTRCARHILQSALTHSTLVAFYNADDRTTLLDLGVIQRQHPTLLLQGSGVDVAHFSASAVPNNPVTFLLLGRLLHSKGVMDFVSAAQQLKQQHPQVRFQLLGDLDVAHPHSIGSRQLQQAQRAGIEYLGYQQDVRPHLNAATVVVVPSQQREGLPRVILEAFATGRPVIATDVPGCRHAVTPGHTGWLVPPRSVTALQAAMLDVVQHPERATALGPACRAEAERRFAVESVTQHLITAFGA
jgi:glycosyltransferase involved in cell wall biosynthesis